MIKGRIVVPKVWRSEIKLLIGFALTSLASMALSWKLPGSIVHGRVVSIGAHTVELSLPLFWIVPLILLCLAVLRIYNVRYVIDSRGLESRVGILGFQQRVVRVRFTDIRSAEIEQTILGRMLNIGDVEVGTAGTGDLEIVFAGVSAPNEVQDMIQREKDRALEILKQSDEPGEDRESA